MPPPFFALLVNTHESVFRIIHLQSGLNSRLVTAQGFFSVVRSETGAPNDSFLPNALKIFFRTIWSAFKVLQMLSKRNCKIFICSVILGHLKPFRVY